MADINDLLVRIDATTEQLRREMRRAEQSVNSGGRRIDASAKRIDRSFAMMNRAALRVAGAFGIAFGVRGLIGHVSTQLEAADNMLKLTQRIGGTVEALSGLQHVANMANVPFNQMTTGLQRMTRRISEAAQGGGAAAGALRELGLDAKALSQLTLDQQFEAIADRLSRVAGESNRVRLAMRIFDSEGVSLLQTMTRGAAGIREFMEEARRLGISLSTEQAEAAAEARKEIIRLTSAWEGFSQTLTIKAAPVIASVLEYVNRSGDVFERQLSDRADHWQGRVDELTQRLDEARAALAKEEESFIPLRAALRRQEVAKLEDELETASANLERLKAELAGLRGEIEEDEDRDPINVSTGIDPIDVDAIRAIERQRRELAESRELLIADARLAAYREGQERLQEVSEGLRTEEEVIRESYRRRLQIIQENTQEGSELQADLIARLDAQTKEQLDALADDISSSFNSLGLSLGRSLQRSLADAFLGIETDFSQMLRRMAIEAATSQVFSMLAGLGGPTGAAFSFLGFGGARADGGEVRAGKYYVVGERGPELLVSGASGSIIPNHALGGSVSINQTLRFDVGLESVDQRIAQATGPISAATVAAVREAMERPAIA